MNRSVAILTVAIVIASSAALADTWEPSLTADYFHGLAFGPYESTQGPGDPVSVAQIKERLGIVAPYTQWVRTYSTWNGFQNIPEEAHKLGLHVAAGTWIAHNRQEEIDNLIEKAKAGWVGIAIIGNEELLFRGRETDASLAALLNDVRVAFDANGLQHIHLAISESFDSLFGRDGTVKCPLTVEAADAILVNIHPFHEGVRVEQGSAVLAERYATAVAAAPGKRMVIGETGWPTAGETKGEAIPSIENAATYLAESVSWAKAKGVEIFTFEAFDEAWKGPEEFERHWGVWDADGSLKVPEPTSVGMLFFGSMALVSRRWRQRRR